MPRKVAKYRVYCETEQAYHYVWHDSAPTTCPVNEAHTINQTMTSIMDVVTDQNVYISAKSYDTTQGYYCMEGGSCPVSASNAVEVQDVQFTYPVCLFGFNFRSGAEHKGDMLDVIISPNTTVGVLMAGATVGSTTFTVNNTVLQYASVGFNISITDGVNTDDCGIMIAKDMNASTITMNKACTHAFNPYTTYVVINIYVVRNYHITEPDHYEVGYGTMSGKPIPANTVIRVVYHNNDLQQKTFAYSYEYTY